MVKFEKKGKKVYVSNVTKNIHPTTSANPKRRENLWLFIIGKGQVIEEVDESEGEEEIEETAEKVELALRSILGFSSPSTMKLKGKIGERELIVMIDCGATHNFIHRQLVDDLKITVTNTTNYGIVIENGTTLQGNRVCKEVTIQLPVVIVLESFFPLELGHLDIILVMAWLYTMGYMGVDWANLTITFTQGNSKVVLKGDASLTKAEVSMKMMISNWEEEDQGFLIEFQSLMLELKVEGKVDPLKLQEEQVYPEIERPV